MRSKSKWARYRSESWDCCRDTYLLVQGGKHVLKLDVSASYNIFITLQIVFPDFTATCEHPASSIDSLDTST